MQHNGITHKSETDVLIVGAGLVDTCTPTSLFTLLSS